ncbi:Hypothetical predicted protein [Olea europaea subsp. europaea]|uniref:Uncharacterized protein n=1 Tax=Olea europaea subsp. europaea TaxID=158383 RepID=A0A8S0PL66_OLEEU|nr:Hypothetical predicted protein [Olea europaea subsp. europaea]
MYNMEAENGGFHHQQHQQGISFKSGTSSSGSGSGSGSSGVVSPMISMGNYYNHAGTDGNFSLNDCATGAAGGIIFSSPVAGNSYGSSFLLDSVPGLKHDTGLAVEWSVEEQYKLEEGLDKYANEPNIMRYIKIAASLRDKTVRDVALRCRWMSRKRRKQEDHILARKVKDRKDKFMESPLKNNMSLASAMNVAPHSLFINHREPSYYMPFEVLTDTTKQLLEENNHAFGQISANISNLKLQENIDLFCRARNNINTVLNEMRSMPGIMSQMPPLSVIINEELASSILPSSSQSVMFGSSGGISLKREPGC